MPNISPGTDDILYLNLRNDITGNRTRYAFYIATSAGVSWSIRYMKCKHFLTSSAIFKAYYFPNFLNVYTVDHMIANLNFNNVYFPLSSTFKYF